MDSHAGAVRVVRTFRVGTDGRLHSTTLAGRTRTQAAAEGPYAWEAGVNDATCPRADHRGPVPGAGCSCGFYGFADLGPLLRSDVPGSHDLVAVVALTGRVIPAQRGARGQHARIEALWLSRKVVRRGLADRIRRRYPGAAVYADRGAMLAEFPVTRLPGQRLRHGPSRWLLALQTVYFLGIWILPMLLSGGGAPEQTVDRSWGYAALGCAVLGSVTVPSLRALPRAWWTSALPTPLLLGARVLTPGLPGLMLALTLIGTSLAGVVTELAVTVATRWRVGRRLGIVDLAPTAARRSPWPDLRPDLRPALFRLLAVITTAMAVGVLAEQLPLAPALALLVVYLTVALLFAVVREKAPRHRVALFLVATSCLPPLLHGLGPGTAAVLAVGSAAALFALGCLHVTVAGRSADGPHRAPPRSAAPVVAGITPSAAPRRPLSRAGRRRTARGRTPPRTSGSTPHRGHPRTQLCSSSRYVGSVRSR